MSRGRRHLLWLAVVLVPVVVAASFIPQIIATVWHWRHGDSVTFRGWEVPVPRGWWPLKNPYDTVLLQKAWPPIEREPQSNIIVEVFGATGGFVFNSEKWKRARTQTMAKRHYNLVAERAARIDDHEAYCLEFAASGDVKEVWVVCDFPTAGLRFEFHGPRAPVSEFYQVVERVRRSPTASQRPRS